jgi:hypothetical protein
LIYARSRSIMGCDLDGVPAIGSRNGPGTFGAVCNLR